MSVGLYPVFERDVVGDDDCTVIGKALCHAVYNWDVPEVFSLNQFFSIDPQEVAALAGYYLPGDETVDEDIGLTPAPPGFQPPSMTWHEPEAGLAAILAAKNALTVSDAAVEKLNTEGNRVDWVIADLEAIEQALILAQAQCVRFHFAMDF